MIVLASEYTLLSYLNVSSVIPRYKGHFYPANRFWKKHKSLFIAEPCYDFNRCNEQRMSENHNWILFIAVSLWFWSVAKYKRPIFKGFNSLHYWAGLNVLKVNCFWSCIPCWGQWGSNPQPLCLESNTLPLSHWAPRTNVRFYVLYDI